MTRWHRHDGDAGRARGDHRAFMAPLAGGGAGVLALLEPSVRMLIDSATTVVFSPRWCLRGSRTAP